MHKPSLYTAVPSRGGMVLWMLAECDAPYDTVVLKLGENNRSPEYLAINPLGKVPALKVGSKILTETVAIITYLAEQFPQKQLIPAEGSIERGEYYRWMCFALQLEYGAIDKMRGIDNPPEIRSSIGYGDFETALNVLRTHLDGREFIVGDRFSAMDLYYSGLLDWFNKVQIVPADEVFDRYTGRHLARAAHLQSLEQEKILAAQVG